MNRTQIAAVLVTALGGVIAANASAAVVLVNNNISTSTTWTANNVYRLQQQIYVLPGATLTIEPGTVIASTTNIGGSLAVCRGAKIFANGTRDNPVIFTSTSDVATWANLPSHPTGKDPKTGSWREAANEWGNLTIMGRAFISASLVPGNSATFNANNVAPMEGLVAAFPGDPNVLYGGGDDNDDSGSLSFVSFRYGGKVIGLNNELNGLSLGGIGRETDIHHVEIMNNVDDGIEIWGGTVNIKYFNIWNVGDDSFDVDQGWRGKAQFGLIVQGYSLNAAQGSGVGDNIFETDGAENSDAQPVTTAVIWNCTAIGQPAPGAGDHGTAWRANARVQYKSCIFMDLGHRLVSFDNLDGDGSQGYGFNGTLSWTDTWDTNFANYSAINAPANPAQYYTAQSSGRLAEIRDSVLFRNQAADAYTEANSLTVDNGSFNNVYVASVNDSAAPVQSVTRAGPVVKGGMTMLQVVGLDPRAKNDATTSTITAPSDGFFTPVSFRGGFGTENWLCGWTATDAFGFNTSPAGSCVVNQPQPCPADINNTGTVNVDDLLLVINAWGVCKGCPADINNTGTVNVDDLLLVINSWGNCP